MFLNLAAPLQQGKPFAATLTFEKAGPVDVTFAVQAIGAREAPAHAGEGHGDHSGHGR
jgi:copper(I)-binding protein